MAETISEPQWKKIKLSLEQPYKDESGHPIPVLYDLTPGGEAIYEHKETSIARLENNLRRIFQERGTDFFDRDENSGFGRNETTADSAGQQSPLEDVTPHETDSAPKAMTMEELYNMKSEILPQLFVALGEMSHARDLLNSILSGPRDPSQNEASALLSATLVTKPPPIESVNAFNAQITIGSKDEALRKAAGLFKSAAESMERSTVKGEKYWVDALRIRRANWGLTPAPLPMGSMTGKGADKTSKDFVISYGLEGSPPASRRRAVAHLTSTGNAPDDIIFPYHQNTGLRISISIPTRSSSPVCTFDSPNIRGATTSLDTRLRAAQTEVVDQEIFSLLVKEAGKLPTASARVSERLIVIDATQGLDLTFELVDTATNVNPVRSNVASGENICELIYHVLRVFLLRRHNGSSVDKRIERNPGEQDPYAILQPVIDILQYRGFCERVQIELRRVVRGLESAGIPSTLSFTPVGEPGHLLVSLLSDPKKTIGGEAVIKIDNWNTLWFTFVSPSTLTAHLSQATLTISSVPRLTQLLMDEIERCVLERICTLGRELCDVVGGTWFIDTDRCVAKWEGCVLNFRISYDENLGIHCSAFRLDNSTGKQGKMRVYDNSKLPLLTWAADVIKESSSHMYNTS